MKAVVLRKEAGGRLSALVEDMDEPQIENGEILVKLEGCGLCGTDIEKMRGEYTAAMPILGHEAVGTVESSSHPDFREGDRVFPHHHVSCGKCALCRRGSATMCDRYRSSNLFPGGFSEKFRVPKWNLERGGVLRIPERLDWEVASLVEPLACCVRGLDRVGAREGDTVLVVGAGPVGLMHAMLLGVMGSRAILSDTSLRRVASARALGLEALSAGQMDVAAEVRRATDGVGADSVVVASGSPVAIVQALRSVRKGGRVSLFGIPPKGAPLDYPVADVYNSEVSLIPTYGATEEETPRALEILTKHASAFRKLITHRYHIAEFHEAVRQAEKGEALKILIVP